VIVALLVPADPSKPWGFTTVRGREDIAVLVGGRPELTRYDHDALMFVHGEGRLLGQQLNARATRYIKTASAAAARNASLRNDEDPTYGLYGDVVITGNEPVGKHGVPKRLVEWFETNATTGGCPRCTSPVPRLHPAVQHGGEGTICPDDFHGDFRPREGESLRDFSRRAYGTGREGRS
jgi:hypothetical protein